MTRSFRGRASLLGGCLLLALAAGCTDEAQVGAEPGDLAGAFVEHPEEADVTGVRGGQSGTEGGGDEGCKPLAPRAVTADEVLPIFQTTPAQIASSLVRETLVGRWLATGSSELSIELDLTGELLLAGTGTDYGASCDAVLEVGVLKVRSADGAIDASVPARITRDADWLTVRAALPGLPGAVLGPALERDVVRAESLLAGLPRPVGPALYIALPPAGIRHAVVYDESAPRGVWTLDPLALRGTAPASFTPAPLFSASCAGAEGPQADPSHHTAFASTNAALTGVAKTWVRCLDSAEQSHAGLQLSEDGTWRYFDLLGGELVARSGFGNEGYVQLIDTSAMNGPGFIQLELLAFGRNFAELEPITSDRIALASETALVFRPWSAPDGWRAAVYQPTQLAVRSLPSGYADGERAGSAACEYPERGLVYDGAEAAPLLSGEFAWCSGALRNSVAGVRFQPSRIELLAEDGRVLESAPFEPSSGVVQLDGRQWSLLVSREPLKVLVQERSEHQSSNAVFSALP